MKLVKFAHLWNIRFSNRSIGSNRLSSALRNFVTSVWREPTWTNKPRRGEKLRPSDRRLPFALFQLRLSLVGDDVPMAARWIFLRCPWVMRLHDGCSTNINKALENSWAPRPSQTHVNPQRYKERTRLELDLLHLLPELAPPGNDTDNASEAKPWKPNRFLISVRIQWKHPIPGRLAHYSTSCFSAWCLVHHMLGKVLVAPLPSSLPPCTTRVVWFVGHKLQIQVPILWVKRCHKPHVWLGMVCLYHLYKNGDLLGGGESHSLGPTWRLLHDLRQNAPLGSSAGGWSPPSVLAGAATARPRGECHRVKFLWQTGRPQKDSHGAFLKSGYPQSSS